MTHRAQRLIATSVFILSLLVTSAMMTPAAAQDLGGKDLGGKDSGGKDLRDIRLGKPVTDLPDAGYVNLACANDSRKTLTTWLGWRDCPADASGFHAIKFGYDPVTSRDGTIVAGHPAVLTLLVDNAGTFLWHPGEIAIRARRLVLHASSAQRRRTARRRRLCQGTLYKDHP